MSFAKIHDRRNVTILRDNMTAGVPDRSRTMRKSHSPKTQGKPMSIDGITVEWHRTGDENWRLYALRVFGAVYKVDGTLGMTAGEHQYVDFGTYHDTPEAWLLAEIALYEPYTGYTGPMA